MKHRFYTTTARATKGMLDAIKGAKTSVYLEMYIFEYDKVGSLFVAALEERLATGVRVVLILDAIGSFGLRSETISELRAKGAEVLFFSYWLTRTHRKILIIDEHIVFLGGVNISGRFSKWKDLHVRLTGKHIAGSALRSFARVYRKCGGKDTHLLTLPSPRVWSRTRMWFQEHGLDRGHRSLRAHYKKTIDQATQTITITTPYLLPRRWLIAHLHAAILRGVKVTIMIPIETDHRIFDRINAYYTTLLDGIGASIRFLPSMNHAKVILIDERVGTVGSQNLDTLSFDWNMEASLFFTSPTMIAELSKIVRKWESEAVLPSFNTPRTWYDPLLFFTLRILRFW